MAGRKLFKSGALSTTMFLVALFYLYSKGVMSLWGSEASKAIRPLRPQQDWTKGLPSSSAALHRRENPIALRSETSNNSSGQIAAHTFHDLGTQFKRRRSVLLRGCKDPDTFSRFQRELLKFSRSLSLCAIEKVGSTTLRAFKDTMKNQIPATPLSITAIVVRHPLSRLASVYRDKFLNGNPLYAYNSEWRKETGSRGSWKLRFVTFWLPALVTQGFLPQTKENFQIIRVNDKLQNIIKNGSIIERFMNASFTFNQFLHHVVWTHDNDMVDKHWVTYTERCDPCRKKFDYILELKTIQEELNYLQHEVLGYRKIIQVPVRHRGYGHPSPGHSDRQYYANVSRELMDRVLDIYKHDFTLFGYKHDL